MSACDPKASVTRDLSSSRDMSQKGEARLAAELPSRCGAIATKLGFFVATRRLGSSVTSELQPRNSIRGTLFDNKRGVQNVGLCRERWKASGAEAFGLDIPSCRNLPLRNANGVCLGEASPPTSQFRGLSCQACCISANGHDFPKLSRSHGQNGPVNGKFIPYGKRSRKTGASWLRRI
jgi:hypothetical protein